MKTILVAAMIFAAATGLKLFATPAAASVSPSRFDFLVKKTAAPSTGAVEFLPVGQLITGAVKDGKLSVTVVGGVTLVLRSDGLIGWKLTEEAEKQFKKEAEGGLKVPTPGYDSGKRK